MNLIPFNSIFYYCATSATGSTTRKIAAFDLDSTLIKTKSGKLFGGNDSTDWEFAFSTVPQILHNFHQNGFHIVIFTNQKGIGSETMQIEHFKNKITDIVSNLNLPIDIFIATQDDYYRKPCTGMWDKFFEFHPNIKLEESFYCGDAAGRPNDFIPGHKKDFSSSDLFFANNIGLEFRLPENVFLSKNYSIPAPPSHNFVGSNKIQTSLMFPSDQNQKLFIMMVGSPASGKSTLAQSILSNAVRINQDLLGTKVKCLKAVKQAVASGSNIIVDNTNPSVASRKEYLDLVPESYYKVAICMDVDKKLAHHLNYVRVQCGKGSIKKIPDIAFNVYFKKFETPTIDEGFSKINHIPFVLREDIKEIHYHFVE